MQANSEIQQRTRKLAEAQWRGLLLNLYAQAKESASPGMTRREFKLWLAMLPSEISSKLSDETFESIDGNGDDRIDVSEMCNFVQGAVNAHLNTFTVNGEFQPPAGLPALSSGLASACLSSACSEEQATPFCVDSFLPIDAQGNEQRRTGTVLPAAGGLGVTDSTIIASTLTGQGRQSPHESNDSNDPAAPARTLRAWPNQKARPKFSDSYLQRLFGPGSSSAAAQRSGGGSSLTSL